MIDPGVIGRLLDHYVAGLEVHHRVVKHHVDFARDNVGVVNRFCIPNRRTGREEASWDYFHPRCAAASPRRAQAVIALSIPVYPSRCHLQSSSGLHRRQRRRLALHGLPHRRARSGGRR
jgi:hypothetical protein